MKVLLSHLESISGSPPCSPHPFHNHLGCEDNECAYEIPLFGVVLPGTTKSAFRMALIIGKNVIKSA